MKTAFTLAFAGIVVAILFAVALGAAVYAQAPAAPAATPAESKVPALTETQRLKVQNVAQQIEIAQLRAQQAQRDFDDARAELGTLIQSLQVEGYTLDLQTLTYTKAPDAPKAPQ